MVSPFPGMDPFIEAYGPWGDFHDDLILEIKRFIAEKLPEGYVVLAAERTYIDYVDPLEERRERQHTMPDVSIWSLPKTSEREAQTSPVAVADSPNAVVMHGLVEVEYRDIFLEIIELDPVRRLVTCIELLSPTNKRYGSVGWYQYQRKRQVFLSGHANLVEIDLLRGGRHMPMEEPWPDSPYRVAVLRKDQAPTMTALSAHFMQPLPPIPVPLAPPDADIPVLLQPLIDAIYARTRYHLLLDYRRPLTPPLSKEENAWLEQRLSERQSA